MPDRIQIRRGTAAFWTAQNPILALGEPGYETDTGKMKVGNGIAAWTGLNYFVSGSGLMAGVRSVNGRQEDVVLTKADVGLDNVDNTTDLTKPISTAVEVALGLKAPLESPAFTGTVSGVTKAMVGLGLADNTADADKAVLTATRLAVARTINGVAFDGSAAITIVDATKEPANANIQAHIATPHVTPDQRAALNANATLAAGNKVISALDIKEWAAADETVSSTSSLTPVAKLSLPFTPPAPGTYEVVWYCEMANSNAARSSFIRVWDGLTVYANASMNSPMAMEYQTVSGHIRVEAIGPKTVYMEFYAGANTAFIRAARMSVRRLT